ncbi:MAG TPA: cupin domain-containing protein [Bryobacteraceae bacterium]|nr:cupin domain-containing protein [Bryobacteraceae bacterium]
MKRSVVAAGLVVLALGFGVRMTAQKQRMSGTATDVTNSEIQAALKKTASAKVSDQQLRVVDIDGEYNVALGVLHRAKTEGKPSGALIHERVTEVYQIVSGNGTFVTGGSLVNPKESPADSEIVRVLAGPSISGTSVQGGVSRKVGPGDMIVIPPNTPHGFSEITSDQVVYTVVRVDSHKVLPAGYVAK